MPLIEHGRTVEVLLVLRLWTLTCMFMLVGTIGLPIEFLPNLLEEVLKAISWRRRRRPTVRGIHLDCSLVL